MTITAVAQPEFYRVFSTEQIAEILTHLHANQMIPFKFFYQGKLVEYWQDLNQRQAESGISSAKNDVAFLKRICIALFQADLPYDRWNIVDIGAANPGLVKKLLGTFLENDLLNAYVALDISQDILALSRQELLSWFPGLNWQGLIWDFERDPAPTLPHAQNENDRVSNLFLFIGGTLCNVVDRATALNNIVAMMQPEELLGISFGVDLAGMPRRELGEDSHISITAAQIVLQWFGIDPDHVRIEFYFDEDWGGYKTDIFFLQGYTISFKLSLAQRAEIGFKAGDRVNIYRFFTYEIEPDTSSPHLFADLEAAGLDVLSYRIDAALLRVLLICKRRV